MHDPTEAIRRVMTANINSQPDEALPEEQWTTDQVRELFEVEGFAAPFVLVRRKSDGKRGTLMFRHSPRVYFGWQESFGQ